MMFEILAETSIKAPEAVIGAILIAVLGWFSRSGYSLVLSRKNSNNERNANSSDCVTRGECRTVQESMERVSNERHETILNAVAEVKQEVKEGMTRLHERIDEVLRKP
jgi:hypothetical protein